MQLSILGPANATKAEIKRAIETKLETGDAPDRYQIDLINWRTGSTSHPSRDSESELHAFRHVIRAARIAISTDRQDEGME